LIRSFALGIKFFGSSEQGGRLRWGGLYDLYLNVHR